MYVSTGDDQSPFSNRRRTFPFGLSSLPAEEADVIRSAEERSPRSFRRHKKTTSVSRRQLGPREVVWKCCFPSDMYMCVYEVGLWFVCLCHMHPAERGRTLQARRGSIHRLCRQGHKAGPLMAKGNTTICSPARALHGGMRNYLHRFWRGQPPPS